jgi:excinuclease UvrABC helicase subunit UvrB
MKALNMSNNFKTHITLLIIIIALSVAVLKAGSYSRLVKSENADLISQHDLLLSKVEALSARLDDVTAGLEEQSAFLEDANNSLARERLKNARLIQDIENMKQANAGSEGAGSEPISGGMV